MKWPWQGTSRMTVSREPLEVLELAERTAALAESRLAETRRRIESRWADAERAIVARRTISALSFSIQLVPPVPARQVRPLKWGKR